MKEDYDIFAGLCLHFVKIPSMAIFCSTMQFLDKDQIINISVDAYLAGNKASQRILI
jgi:hypothetical protein